MKARVSSYQSIASAEIEAAGFTAITGSSNIGKSALLRAVAAALFGQEGDHFVKKGDAAAAVTVEHDGHVIEWQKVRKKRPGLENCVVVDGEKFTRIGKGHAELVGGLGFRAIRAGGELVRPQYATQHDDIFLLTATPNAAAEVFKMLGRVDVVTRAQGSARSDLRKTHGEREIREKDSADAWESLCEMGWLVAFEEFFRRLGGKQEKLEVEAAVDLRVLETLDVLETLGEPRPLPAEPVLPDADPVADLLKKIEEFEQVAPRGDLPESPDLTVVSSRAAEASRALEAVAAYEEFYDGEQLALARLSQAECDVLSAEMRKLALEEELGACPVCEREFEPGAPEMGAAARKLEVT